MTPEQDEALTKAAAYCWERARDCLVARDRNLRNTLIRETYAAKANAFTEAAQAIQGMRN